MVIPSQAGVKTGRCRDLTADLHMREEKVQTTNPKGASKGVDGKHNPLAVGSNPTEGTKIQNEKPGPDRSGLFPSAEIIS
jgi:hypothetical protein